MTQWSLTSRPARSHGQLCDLSSANFRHFLTPNPCPRCFRVEHRRVNLSSRKGTFALPPVVVIWRADHQCYGRRCDNAKSQPAAGPRGLAAQTTAFVMRLKSGSRDFSIIMGADRPIAPQVIVGQTACRRSSSRRTSEFGRIPPQWSQASCCPTTPCWRAPDRLSEDVPELYSAEWDRS